MNPNGTPLKASLLAIPDSMAGTLSGLYDVLSSFPLLATFYDSVPGAPPFDVEIVGPGAGVTSTASGLPIPVDRPLATADATDLVIVPSMMVEEGEWIPGRYAEVVEWLRAMHAGGAMLCSACSGVLLVAETGLLEGLDATIHWAYAPTFRRNFPNVNLRVEELLIATGSRRELVMSGASASWHDLALYLVARLVGPTAAAAIAKFLLLQWHADGQAPYVAFLPPTEHGDAQVLGLQEWLKRNQATANPIQELTKRSGLPARTMKRRFKKATGLSPIVYVQKLRVEEAKRRLERTDTPVDTISYEVGYEDPAFFRRLFKRTVRLTPADYRRRFRMPELSRFEVAPEGDEGGSSSRDSRIHRRRASGGW